MRVSNNIITRTSQLRLQQGLQGINRVRDDIATGIRIRRMSDDATAGGEVVRIGSSMRALTQFRRNAQSGIARATAEEAVLDQYSNVLTRASELSITAANGTSDNQARQIVKAEVDQMLSLAVRLGNTRFGDEYLFGGNRGMEKPFTEPPPATGSFSALQLSGSPVDPTGNITLEIGDNKFVTPTHNGKEVFLDTDGLDALRELSDALGANDLARIAAATTRLNSAVSDVQSLVGTQGARINEMEDALVNIEATEFNLKAFRSDLRDTEVDKAMVELVGKQTLYQAAMSATSRILGLSLSNYL
ncbi:MAG: hypothetical protein IBJ03_06550 [Gemmatimonadaceae bacterium]|nr:hypothetical protein [Gemmatimonadaceae bacterium]